MSWLIRHDKLSRWVAPTELAIAVSLCALALTSSVGGVESANRPESLPPASRAVSDTGFPDSYREAVHRVSSALASDVSVPWTKERGRGAEDNACFSRNHHDRNWAVCFGSNGYTQMIKVTLFGWGANATDASGPLEQLLTVATPRATRDERAQVLALLKSGRSGRACIVDTLFVIQTTDTGEVVALNAARPPTPTVPRPGHAPCGGW